MVFVNLNQMINSFTEKTKSNLISHRRIFVFSQQRRRVNHLWGKKNTLPPGGTYDHAPPPPHLLR